MRRSGFGVHQSHLLFDHALHAEQSDADLVLDQFAHRSDAAVAQMVDVVGTAFALVDADHGPNNRNNVFQTECHQVVVGGLSEPAVQLITANAAQVIPSGTEEQVPDQGPGVLQAGRFTRPQPAVELDLGGRDAPCGVAVEVFIFVEPFPERSEVVLFEVQVLGFKDRVLVQGCLHVVVNLIGVDVREQGHHGIVVGHAQSAEKHGRGNLAFAVDFDRDDVLGAGLKLEPGAA